MNGPLPPKDIEKIVFAGDSARRPDEGPGKGIARRFDEGDHVVARNIQPRGHTRLPRYARGKKGVVHRVHGVFVFADANAMGLGEQPQFLYSVRFPARVLWGDEASERDSLYLDLWDAHLDPA